VTLYVMMDDGLCNPYFKTKVTILRKLLGFEQIPFFSVALHSLTFRMTSVQSIDLFFLNKNFLFDWYLDKRFWIKPLFEISWDEMNAVGLFAWFGFLLILERNSFQNMLIWVLNCWNLNQSYCNFEFIKITVKLLHFKS